MLHLLHLLLLLLLCHLLLLSQYGLQYATISKYCFLPFFQCPACGIVFPLKPASLPPTHQLASSRPFLVIHSQSVPCVGYIRFSVSFLCYVCSVSKLVLPAARVKEVIELLIDYTSLITFSIFFRILFVLVIHRFVLCFMYLFLYNLRCTT